MTEQHYIAAEIYKAMANPKRVAILEMLSKGEMSVDEISKKLKVPKSNVSQHLSHLRHVGIVKPRRAGLSVFYEIVHGGVKRLGAARVGDAK